MLTGDVLILKGWPDLTARGRWNSDHTIDLMVGETTYKLFPLPADHTTWSLLRPVRFTVLRAYECGVQQNKLRFSSEYAWSRSRYIRECSS